MSYHRGRRLPGRYGGANTVADHIAVLYQANAQVPELAWRMEMMARVDSRRVTHDFVNALRELEIGFSIAWPAAVGASSFGCSVPGRLCSPPPVGACAHFPQPEQAPLRDYFSVPPGCLLRARRQGDASWVPSDQPFAATSPGWGLFCLR